MPSIPCLKSESRCFPCAEDNPLANLSIEPADRNIWLSVYFGRPRNVTPNTWTTVACVGFCESAISQTDADDCATRRAEDCLPVGDITDDPPPPDPPISPTLFCNQETSCQSGSNCYTLPACTVFAGSQAEADAIAQSLCNSRVLDPAQSGPCAPVVPPPVVPVGCPAESGAAAPDSLEITEQVTWVESQTINAPDPWANDGNIMTFPTYDLPPGGYKIHNLNGYNIFFNEICPLVESAAIIYPALRDSESTIIEQNQCIAGFCLGLAEDPTRDNCELELSFAAPGERLNGTGACLFVVSTYVVLGGFNHTPVEPHVFNLEQLSGLIPQPRKLQITSYSAPLFADPTGAAGWNGAFNTRDFYTAVGLRWEAPAAGVFGGAQLEYTMSHPTSASGKGWMLNIYSAGFILIWRGYKAVGSTSIGRYYRDSTTTPIGPACLVCADASDDQWYP